MQYYPFSIVRSNFTNFILEKNNSPPFNPDLPTIFIDIDYTILNTFVFKKVFFDSISLFDKKLSKDKVEETYTNSKTSENYYDYKKHLEILAEITKSDKDSIKLFLEKKILNIFKNDNAELIYSDIKKFLEKYNSSANFIVFTSGDYDFQQQKLVFLLKSINFSPCFNIFVRNSYKGSVVKKLVKENLIPNNSKLLFIDDNIDELEDIYRENRSENLKFIRIIHPNGVYNHKENKNPNIFEEYQDLNKVELNLL